MSDAAVLEIERQLAAPFDSNEVKWKPQAISGSRALAVAYVDARVIQDRLDEVLGVTGWQDHYEFLSDGSCLCKLSARIAGEWIVKMDVGGQSEQPDEGDRKKAALSDSLKRAAVKFGIGRYLYRLPSQWADYDPKKKCFAKTPQLPAAAISASRASKLPADGAELEARLVRHEQALVAAGRCQEGELIAFARQSYAREFNVGDAVPALPQWGRRGIELTVKSVKEFDAAHPAAKANSPSASNGTAPPAVINDQQLAEFSALMERKLGGERRIWPLVREGFKLERFMRSDQLPAALFLDVMRAVEVEADAPAAKQ